MAAELGRDIRTIDRGYKVLEDDGWIRRQRGGRDEPVTITLSIPAENADIHRFGNKSGVGKRDIQVSRLEAVHTRHKTGSYATQNGSIRDTQHVASKEQEVQEEQSAAPPRAPEFVDIAGPGTSLSIERDRAPEGALSQVETEDDAETTRIVETLEDTFGLDFGDKADALPRIIAELLKLGDTGEQIIEDAKAEAEHLNGKSLVLSVWSRRRLSERSGTWKDPELNGATRKLENAAAKPSSVPKRDAERRSNRTRCAGDCGAVCR